MNFGVKTAGGVNQQHVNAAAFRSLHSIKDHRRRVGASAMFDDVHAGALRPNLELFDGSGPKRIACHDQHSLARLFVLSSHFADRCGLADTIDTEKENYPRS